MIDREDTRKETLRAFYRGSLIFSSDGRWLHPLFELEAFLKQQTYDGGDLYVEDDVVGKASALLICRMGIRKVRAGVLSRLAERVFREENIEYSFQEKVERILCQTEELLASVDDIETAYDLLKERARL